MPETESQEVDARQPESQPPPLPIPTPAPQTPAEDGLTTEDVVLYVFGALVAVLVAAFMYSSQAKEEARIAVFCKTVQTISPHSSHDSQSTATFLRYSFAAAAFPSTTSRANVSLMVGMLLALMGSLLIVRGVRDAPFTGEANAVETLQVKFASSSPGLVLAFLGCFIITLTIWRGARFEIVEPYTTDGVRVEAQHQTFRLRQKLHKAR